METLTVPKRFWSAVGFCILLVSTQASAESTSWEMSNAAGMQAYQQVRYAKAEEAWLGALKEAESFGPQDPRLATSLNNLAVLYASQGKYPEAEPLHQRALAIREKALGPEHPDVATGFHNLAVLYASQRRYAEAEPLYRRALAIDEKALGPEHPNLSTSLENYAALLRKMNREDEATQMEARAKRIRKKSARQENDRARLVIRQFGYR